MKPHEKLGVAIADAGYAWTPEMRSAWEELDRQQDRIAELEKALDWIATVNAMDYEYQDVAKSVLKERHEIK